MDQLRFFGSLSSSSGRAPRSRLSSFLAAAVALVGVALLAPACGTSDTGGSGGGSGGGTSTSTGSCTGVIVNGECMKCDGVIVNGVCEGKCTADQCVANNACVGNRCMLKCASHRDCDPAGAQDCVPAKDDETGADITVCQFSGKPAGMGVGCPFGNECEAWRACPDTGICFSFQCGGDMAACVQDADACQGIENCVFGKCPDGSGCRTDCFTACNQWLTCEGKGEADADAYCTKRDCETDDDCIGGYQCTIIRDPHEICDSNPPKGDNGFCGTTNEPCISLPDGTSRFEGSACMLRKSCMKRGRGAPCKTDIDCSQFDNLACVAYGGESRCAPKCLVNADCTKDATCDPGLGACVPRYGSWVGPKETFCTPCWNDEDCGTKGTYWACAELSNGMTACFDESFPDTCTTDNDCPTSPSGKHGSCLDEDFGLSPGDSSYHRCYLPVNLNTNNTSCW